MVTEFLTVSALNGCGGRLTFGEKMSLISERSVVRLYSQSQMPPGGAGKSHVAGDLE